MTRKCEYGVTNVIH